METACLITARDGSSACAPIVDPDLAPDTLSDGTVPRAPIAARVAALMSQQHTAPLAAPIARTIPPTPATLVERARITQLTPLTYAVHDHPDPASIAAAPVLPMNDAATRARDIARDLARDTARKRIGLGALGVALASALSIAFLASSQDADSAPGQTELSSAVLPGAGQPTTMQLAPMTTPEEAPLTPAPSLRPVQRRPVALPRPIPLPQTRK